MGDDTRIKFLWLYSALCLISTYYCGPLQIRIKKFSLTLLHAAAAHTHYQCDQILDLKICPSVSKRCLNKIHRSFYINWSFSK